MKVVGAVLAGMVLVSCKTVRPPVMDVLAARPPNADFGVKDAAIADETFGMVSYKAKDGVVVSVSVYPIPSLNRDAEEALSVAESLYTELKERGDASTTERKWRGHTVLRYGTVVESQNPKGQISSIVYLDKKVVLVQVAGDSGPKFYAKADKITDQYLDANRASLRVISP